MMISTRGRYALRVMIDLAENVDQGYIPMKQIAARQGISLKYLERIIPILSQHNFVEGLQGKGGGYRLGKAPEECKIGDILRLTERNLAPVACLECGEVQCDRMGECRTLPMWSELHKIVDQYFDGITLADLMKKDN